MQEEQLGAEEHGRLNHGQGLLQPLAARHHAKVHDGSRTGIALNPLTHDVPKRERDMIKTCDDSEGTSVRDKQYEPCFTIETLRVSLSTRDKPWVYTDTSDTTLTGKLDSGLSVVCPPPLWECSDSVTPPVIDTRLRGN